MKKLSDSVLKKIEKEYPKGTRIRLIRMEDPFAPPPGTEGTVQYVDGIGGIAVEWDNGSCLGVFYGFDKFEKVL